MGLCLGFRVLNLGFGVSGVFGGFRVLGPMKVH